MKLLDDLLSTIDADAPVRDVRQGIFQTAVWTRNCGLASTPHEIVGQHGHPQIGEAGTLLDKTAGELARAAYSENQVEAAIGMATVNSLLDVDEERCVELNARDLLAEKGKNKKIAIIGHFPFLEELCTVATELWTIDRAPHEGVLPERAAETLIPEADVVGITGAAFANHTIEHLLWLCRKKAYVVILGGTAPLSPVLFDHGVDAVSGTRVIDPEIVLRCVSQGATFRQIRGIRLLTMTK